MLTIALRRANLDDAAGIASLLRSIDSLRYVRSSSDVEVEAFVNRELALWLADDSHAVYVATSRDTIVGYLSVHWLPFLLMPGPEGYVSELFVRPEARGRGVGTSLLQLAEEEARSRGCTRLSLVNPRNRESYARGFYGKRGWKERPDRVSFQLDLRP